jgi:bifunctional UDP-N-acetylglucosamine pyrophosphorylase/glucosamine-1-phosphate N-acetyltransferase
MKNNNVQVIILAAGKGSRMKSKLPKVLQKLSGSPLLSHVISTAQKISSEIHVVYGFKGDLIKAEFKNEPVVWVEQVEQLGTGHAVAQAMPGISDASISLILYGDVPLIQESTLNELINKAKDSEIALLSVNLDNPAGYGRIVRKNKVIQSIVEQKDAATEQLKIKEVNTGIIAVNSSLLKTYLGQLNSDNAQGELYLTDIIEMAVNDGKTISSVTAKSEFEVAGVNDKLQLANLERIYQRNLSTEFMELGLTLGDPLRFDCRGSLVFGQDCEIDVNVIIEGNVILGNNSTIAPNCIIKNTAIGDNVTVLSNSIIEDATIKNNVSIGPFARIRPEVIIDDNAKIGNFVEIKKSKIGRGSKISHLSYIGDTTMGEMVNIGAGVITCNYDGVNKHQTLIEDGAFIGSNAQLVAPVTIGKNATIGAGSKVTKDAPEERLTLSLFQQETRVNWKRPIKK